MNLLNSRFIIMLFDIDNFNYIELFRPQLIVVIL